MNAQTEILEATPLLTAEGEPFKPGYCRKNLYVYNREAVKNKLRLKEWDFYQVSDGKKMLQINFANIALGAAATISYVDLKTGQKKGGAGILPFTVNRCIPPLNSSEPYHFEFAHGGAKFSSDFDGAVRRVSYSDKNFEAAFSARLIGAGESITILFPFKTPARFFYTDKVNCMPAKGYVKYRGETLWEFSEEEAFAVLDWGRGAWPYKNHWYWGNGATRLPDGRIFGFELTWGIGDESNATETMLFMDGKAYKIGAVSLTEEPDGRWMEPWHFVSEDGKFDMVMQPFFDNANPLDLGILQFSCHQVHGLWSGRAEIDGETIEINDMYAFCEKMYNKW